MYLGYAAPLTAHRIRPHLRSTSRLPPSQRTSFFVESKSKSASTSQGPRSGTHRVINFGQLPLPLPAAFRPAAACPVYRATKQLAAFPSILCSPGLGVSVPFEALLRTSLLIGSANTRQSFVGFASRCGVCLLASRAARGTARCVYQVHVGQLSVPWSGLVTEKVASPLITFQGPMWLCVVLQASRAV